MALRTRLKRLEDAAEKSDFGHRVAFITYAENEKSKAEAIAEWEAMNGPIEACHTVFITSYEA